MTIDFYYDSKFYRLVSNIARDKSTKATETENTYFYTDEVIYCKQKSDVKSKEQIFEYSNENIILTRDEVLSNKFSTLKKQDSIVAAITKANLSTSIDMIDRTNVMKNGGYLIIDEIENHLHKKLVQVIIELFTDPTINKTGATLIFSTHYAEILDSIGRKDNIFLLVRDEKHTAVAKRYSDLIKRNDIKKSEVYLSNFIKGTAPRYENIARMRVFLHNKSAKRKPEPGSFKFRVFKR